MFQLHAIQRTKIADRLAAALFIVALLAQAVPVAEAGPPPPQEALSAPGPGLDPSLKHVFIPNLVLDSPEAPPLPVPDPVPDGEILPDALTNEPVSPLGTEVVVDDWDAGFAHDPNPWWWDQNTYGHPGGSFPTCSGYGGDAHWTYAQTINQPDISWGRWTPNLSQTGRYRVYAYIPWVNTRVDDTRRAQYRISHRNGVTLRVVQQDHAWCHWIDLGEYSFDSGTDPSKGSVYLGDNTGGESPRRSIIYDAVKFVLVAPSYPNVSTQEPPPVSFNDPPAPVPHSLEERTPEYISRRSWDTDGPDKSLRVGQVIPVEFRIVNDGDLPWYKTGTGSHNPVYLGTSNTRDRNSPMHDPNDNRWASPKRIKLVQDVVRPGETAHFRFNLLTHASGNHVECFELVADAVNPNLPHGWFGGRVCLKVTVRGDKPAKPQLSEHLDLTPASPVEEQAVRATFTVCNDGETAKDLGDLLVKVWKDGNDGTAADFPAVTVGNLTEGQCKTYDQTLSGGWPAGSYQAKAGYNDGSWHVLKTREGVANAQDFSVLTPAFVTLKDGTRLTLDPNTVWQGGQAVRAGFIAKNTGQATTTEKLRAIVDGGPDFAATGNLTFAGGQEHTYDQSRSFTDRGVYWVIAQHLPEGAGWTDLAGEGREVLRVFAPAPLEKVEHKGITEESGYAGEPVNTASGNFVSRHRDLLAPAPGLPFLVERSYNVVGDTEDPDAIQDGAFGYGWTWNYDMQVEWRSDQTANVLGEDGHVEYYVGDVIMLDPDQPPDPYPFQIEGRYVYSGTLSEANELYRQPDGSFVMTTTEQLIYRFAAQDAAAPYQREWWRLTEISDADGHDLTIHRDSNARVTGVTDGMGRTHAVTSDGSGHIIAITTEDGRSVNYSYDANGNLATFTDAEGDTLTYAYDANHRLSDGIDGEGNHFVENEFDAEGRVVQQTTGRGQAVLRGADGNILETVTEPGYTGTFTYETTAQYLARQGSSSTSARFLASLESDTATTYTDPLDQDTIHFHDGEDRLVMATDPAGESLVYSYDDNNNVASQTDRNGNVTVFTYDERGNRLTKTDALGNIWRYSYDERNNRLSETDPLGNTTLYDYDEADQLIRVADPLGFTRVYTYNVEGLRTAEWDEDGNGTYYTFDELGQPTVITETVSAGDGEIELSITHKTYDDRGNLLSITDPEGRIATYQYDDLDRLISSVDPISSVITYTYDATGNLIAESDGMGNLKYRSYNASGWLVGETDFAGNLYTYEYDALGRRISEMDPAGHTITTTYDIAGNVVAQKDRRGFVTHFSYDANGNMVQEIDALGNIVTYDYDALNRRVATTRPSPTGAGTVTQRWVYNAAGRLVQEIDEAGLVTTHVYDAKGRRITTTDALDNITRYEYDRADRLIHMVDPLGNTTSYVYDALGRRIKTYDRLGNLVQDQYDLVGNRQAHIDANGKKTRYEYDDNDRVLRVFDPLDNRTSNAYDSRGNLISQVDPRGYITRHQYDANSNHTGMTDGRGFDWFYEYDEVNRLQREIDPLSQVTRQVYDEAGNLLQRIDARGFSTHRVYDSLGRVVEERDARGYSTFFAYNAAGMLVSKTDALGNVTHYEYDSRGNQVREIDPLGNVTTTEYDALNRPIRIVDALDRVTTMSYDAAGRLLERTEPSGATTRFTYDAEGRVIATEDALGYFTSTVYDGQGRRLYTYDQRRNPTSFAYNAAGREISQTDALGSNSQMFYDPAGNITGTVDYRGALTLMAYDGNGNLVQRTDAAGSVTTYTYDELNRKVGETDPAGYTRTFAYDETGNLVQVALPGGQATAYQYDGNGNRTAMVDAEGYTWSYEYDPLNRLTAEVDPLGQRMEYEYDALGPRTLLRNRGGNETQYGYDALGRLVRVTDAEGRITRYLYDAAGNMMAHIDPAGQMSRFSYDLGGRRVRETDPLGRTWHRQFDAAGNEIARINPAGQVISTTFDSLSRPLVVEFTGSRVEYGYDPNGNRTVMTDTLGVTTYTYSQLNQLASSTDSSGQTVYTYDSRGDRASITYPGGSQVDYLYDENGWLDTVSDAGGVTTYTRDDRGALAAITYPTNAGVTYAFDEAGRLLSQVNHDSNGQTIAGYIYQLDANGNRTQTVETQGGGTLVQAYTYDGLDRLTSSFSSDGAQHSYFFDAAGNRNRVQGARFDPSGQLEGYSIDYSYDAANHLISAVDSVRGVTTYTYDRAGNRTREASDDLIQAYTFDPANQLVSAVVLVNSGGTWNYRNDQTEAYQYDGDGRRVRKSVVDDSNATLWQRWYRYDDARLWDVLTETGTPADPVALARYTYGEGRDKLAVVDGNGRHFFHHDGLTSVVGYSDDAGAAASAQMARYGDFGDLVDGASALLTAWSYTGHESDSYTGLIYAKHRYYDPATAVWLSPDSYPGQPDSPLTLHRYLYVQANPINHIDPLGLFDWNTGTIQRGDTLTAIAWAYGVSVDQIMNVNPQIANPNLIYAGQHLNLPHKRSSKSETERQAGQAMINGIQGAQCGTRCGQVYYVRAGDALSVIASRFGIADWYKDIYLPNRQIIGSNPAVILPGQQLALPCEIEASAENVGKMEQDQLVPKAVMEPTLQTPVTHEPYGESKHDPLDSLGCSGAWRRDGTLDFSVCKDTYIGPVHTPSREEAIAQLSYLLRKTGLLSTLYRSLSEIGVVAEVDTQAIQTGPIAYQPDQTMSAFAGLIGLAAETGQTLSDLLSTAKLNELAATYLDTYGMLATMDAIDEMERLLDPYYRLMYQNRRTNLPFSWLYFINQYGY